MHSFFGWLAGQNWIVPIIEQQLLNALGNSRFSTDSQFKALTDLLVIKGTITRAEADELVADTAGR